MADELIPVEKFIPPPTASTDLIDPSQFIPPPTTVATPVATPEPWPVPSGPDPQFSQPAVEMPRLNTIANALEDTATLPIRAGLSMGRALMSDEAQNLGPMGLFAAPAIAAKNDIVNPLIDKISTGEINPYEMSAQTLAETGVGAVGHTLSKIPGPVGLTAKLVTPMSVASVGELVNYFWPHEDAEDGHANEEHLNNVIRNSTSLYSLSGLARLVGSTGTFVKDKAPGTIDDMRDAAQKALAGDKPVFERKAAKQGITVLDLEGNEVQPGQKVDKHLLTYKTKLDDTRGVLEEKGYFDNYKDPQNFLARLQNGKDTALARRAEILEGIDDDIVSKVENPTPKGKPLATPKIEPELGVLNKELNDLKIYNPGDTSTRRLYNSVKNRMVRRVEQTLTKEGAEELQARGANLPDSILDRMYSKKSQVVGTGYRPTGEIQVGVEPRVSGYTPDPYSGAPVAQYADNPVMATNVERYKIRASSVPTYQTPQVMSLDGLYKLKTEFQNKADRFFLRAGKSGDRAYNVARAYAKGALAVQDTIKAVQDKYVSAGLLTKAQVKELADINAEVSAALTWEPMARGIAAQTMPGASAATERLAGKGIVEKGVNLASKWIDRGINRLGPGAQSAATAIGGGMQDMGALGLNPATGPLLQDQRELRQPLQFPRDSGRFFSISPDLIGEAFGPQVAKDFLDNQSSPPDIQREFMYRLAQKDPTMFQDPPASLRGFNIVDGVVSKDDIGRASNYLKKMLDKPGADPRVIYQLRSAIHSEQPLEVHPAPTATAEVEDLTRKVNTGMGQRMDFGY